MPITIKTAKCKCGNDYIDFDNQLGGCPKCAEDQVYAEAQQKILKNLTYMTVDVAFKIVLRLLTNEAVRIKIEDGLKVQRLSCEESHASVAKPTEPEASGLCNYIKKLFCRRK